MSYPLQQHPHRSNGMLPNSFGSSRSKADGMKGLPTPSLPTISTSLYDEVHSPASSASTTTRASGRAQLLAGLRTAPKTPVGAENGNVARSFDGDIYGDSSQANIGLLFNRADRAFGHEISRNVQLYSNGPVNLARSVVSQEHFHGLPFNNFGGLPTPPTSSTYSYQPETDYDPNFYADLITRNISLAQQQQLAQHMRMTHQAQHSQHQIQPTHVQSPIAQSSGTPPISPGVYAPTISNHQAIHPFYSVYSPINTQYNYVPHQSRNAQTTLRSSVIPEHNPAMTLASQSSLSSSPPPTESVTRTSSSRSSPSPTRDFVSHTTTKKTPSPPPSVPTFRRGHKKCISLSGCTSSNPALADGGPKTSIPKFFNVPSTPLNSTFGGRGDHPVRQPRGPPALEEILAKPSAKVEGSKNFSSRQRRRALTKLVNAGMERRGTKPSVTSAVSMMPLSEHDVVYFAEDSDTQKRNIDMQNVPMYRTEGRHTPKRAGLAPPNLATSSTEKRRSAIF
ncbi:hypothetical protein ABW20_dc0106401 [Dactylellina cionopaga]|nr:hypothetical protein ABW20_dc0106401 [Dactylellina cionopaga]